MSPALYSSLHTLSGARERPGEYIKQMQARPAPPPLRQETPPTGQIPGLHDATTPLDEDDLDEERSAGKVGLQKTWSQFGDYSDSDEESDFILLDADATLTATPNTRDKDAMPTHIPMAASAEEGRPRRHCPPALFPTSSALSGSKEKPLDFASSDEDAHVSDKQPIQHSAVNFCYGDDSIGDADLDRLTPVPCNFPLPTSLRCF